MCKSAMLATIGMFRVWMWGDGLGFMLTVGATLVAIPLMGCTVGSMLPLLLRRIAYTLLTLALLSARSIFPLLGL